MSPLRGAGPVEPAADGDAGTDGYASDWLDLRATADDRSRSTALWARLLTSLGTAGPLHLLDVGCGTGAMARWCAARSPAPTLVTLLDPDPELLAVATERLPADGVGLAEAVTGTVADLPRLLRGQRPDAVVASALLDVLATDAVDGLLDAVLAAGVPLLVSLTVTGEVHLDPPDPGDDAAREAVRRTATAGGALGPGASRHLVTTARRRGADVRSAATPWRLDPVVDRALLHAWWDGWVAAAAQGSPPAERGVVVAWAEERRALVDEHGLAVEVDHEDVLVLPPDRAGGAP